MGQVKFLNSLHRPDFDEVRRLEDLQFFIHQYREEVLDIIGNEVNLKYWTKAQSETMAKAMRKEIGVVPNDN